MTAPSWMDKANQVRQEAVAEAEGNPPDRLRLLSLSELRKNRKIKPWRVKKYFPSKGVAIVFGAYGGGKTLALVELARCIASGIPFAGNETKQGAIDFLTGEANEGMTLRLSASVQAHQGSFDLPIRVSDRGGNLDTEDGLNDVYAALDALPERPAVVVVDTLSRWMDGDENSTHDGASFLRSLDAIRDRYECLVICAHHTTKSDPTSIRGSGTFGGGADAMFLVTKHSEGGKTIIRMDCAKMKEGAEPPPLAYELNEIELEGFETEDGEPVTSAWLSPHEIPEAAKTGRKATDIPPAIVQRIVEEYPNASQNELAHIIVERLPERMGGLKVSLSKARRIIVMLATLEPPQLIRVESGGKITYKLPVTAETEAKV